MPRNRAEEPDSRNRQRKTPERQAQGVSVRPRDGRDDKEVSQENDAGQSGVGRSAGIPMGGMPYMGGGYSSSASSSASGIADSTDAGITAGVAAGAATSAGVGSMANAMAADDASEMADVADAGTPLDGIENAGSGGADVSDVGDAGAPSVGGGGSGGGGGGSDGASVADSVARTDKVSDAIDTNNSIDAETEGSFDGLTEASTEDGESFVDSHAEEDMSGSEGTGIAIDENGAGGGAAPVPAPSYRAPGGGSERELYRQLRNAGFSEEDSNMLVDIMRDGTVDPREKRLLHDWLDGKDGANPSDGDAPVNADMRGEVDPHSDGETGPSDSGDAGTDDDSGASGIVDEGGNHTEADHVQGDEEASPDSSARDGEVADETGGRQVPHSTTERNPNLRIVEDKDGNLTLYKDVDGDGEWDTVVHMDKDGNTEVVHYRTDDDSNSGDSAEMHEASTDDSSQADGSTRDTSENGPQQPSLGDGQSVDYSHDTGDSSNMSPSKDGKTSDGGPGVTSDSGVVPIIPIVPPVTPTDNDSVSTDNAVVDHSNQGGDTIDKGGSSGGDTDGHQQDEVTDHGAIDDGNDGGDNNDNTDNNGNNGGSVTPKTSTWEFDHLDTTSFADAFKKAQGVASDVATLKSGIVAATTEAGQGWIGKGYSAFSSLCLTIEQQIKDISKEFDEFADALADAESSYIEADREIATIINSYSESAASNSSGGSSSSGGGRHG